MALDLLIREQYGQLNFVDNTIESLTGDIDIQIGETGSAANLKLNRNVVLAPGKTFGLVDTVTLNIAELSVTDGVLNIDGANQLQVGQLKFIDNTIESLTGDIDIQIGTTGSAADLILNRDVIIAPGKTFSINGNKQFNYGQFSNTQTQSGSANTAYPIQLNTVEFSNGVTLSSGSRIYVQNTGTYNIQFSAQLHTTANQAVDFSVWFAMTGSSIDNSNTDFSIEKVTGGGFQVAALNYLTSITSGSYVELQYSKTTDQGQIQAKSAQTLPTRPATPSTIVTVTQIA